VAGTAQHEDFVDVTGNKAYFLPQAQHKHKAHSQTVVCNQN